MPTTSDSPTAPKRRTQAERREATRAALLEATLKCLFEFGYSGTTTARVADRAGVSRGAQLHHFPSKAELVRAAVEFLARRRIDELREGLVELPAGSRRLETLLDVLWDAHQGDVFDATLEVWVASRTDPELRQGLVELERGVSQSIWELVEDVLGTESGRPGFRDDFDFALATTRGIALLRIASGGSSQAVTRRWQAARERLLQLMA